MGLVLRLRKMGSNIFRIYEVDDTAYIVPAGSDEDQHEAVVNQVQALINAAAIGKTYVQINIKHAPRASIRFMPNQYKACVVEWEE